MGPAPLGGGALPRRWAGVRFRFDTIPVDEEYDDGLVCVPVRQAVFDEVRHSNGTVPATVALDMALEHGQ